MTEARLRDRSGIPDTIKNSHKTTQSNKRKTQKSVLVQTISDKQQLQ